MDRRTTWLLFVVVIAAVVVTMIMNGTGSGSKLAFDASGVPPYPAPDTLYPAIVKYVSDVDKPLVVGLKVQPLNIDPLYCPGWEQVPVKSRYTPQMDQPFFLKQYALKIERTPSDRNPRYYYPEWTVHQARSTFGGLFGYDKVYEKYERDGDIYIRLKKITKKVRHQPAHGYYVNTSWMDRDNKDTFRYAVNDIIGALEDGGDIVPTPVEKYLFCKLGATEVPTATD